MASSSSSNSNNAGPFKLGIDEERNPLWKYASNIQKLVYSGGNRAWTCNYCGNGYTSSYTRLRAHLLKIGGKGIGVCKRVTNEDIVGMKKLEDESLRNIESSKSKADLLPGSTTCFSIPPLPPPYPHVLCQGTSKKRRGDSTIDKVFDLQPIDQFDRNYLDAQIARMFYSAGLSFNLARNPHYVNSFSLAAKPNMDDYVPPGYNELRTTLLQQEKARIEMLLGRIKNTWVEKGASIVSNGWGDPQRKPIINFMVASQRGSMFIKSHHSSGVTKDHHFIAEKLEEVINEIGDHKVVQIITDNVANCKAAGEIIEDKFPCIFWTPCVVDTLNLALKDICAARSNQEVHEECRWITKVHDDLLLVKNFVMNHEMRLDIFNRFNSLKLLAVADTRFASIVVMLKRFKRLRLPLQTMFIGEAWEKYKEVDTRTSQTMRALVLKEELWDKINYIIAFTDPIYDMLCDFDIDKPCLHLVYEMWGTMIEKVKKAVYANDMLSPDELSSLDHMIHEILVAHRAKICTPLHCLAHSLNPKYYSDQWLEEGEGRVPPHRDSIVSSGRIKCFRRLFPNEDEFNAVVAEYGSFSLKSGYFAESDSIDFRCGLEPMYWWANYGASAPFLQKLAFKVLGQPASSSCCERNWSTYSFIHSIEKNKLAPKQAEDLIFVHNNLRLLSRSSAEYEAEETKMWDVGGDEFGSMDDMGVLEIANLTLDEPELEYAFWDDKVKLERC